MGQVTKTNTEIEDPTHLSANHSTDVQSDFNRKKGYLFGFVIHFLFRQPLFVHQLL